MMGDFNLALLIVAVVVCVVVLLVSVYLLVNYQHPDDLNQAYFPKLVVILGISVAAISILMLPADVANRQACRHSIYNGACSLTLPMKQLWLAVYIVDALLVFFVIPFAMFYYEGDQEKGIGKRLKSALLWVLTSAIVCGLVLGVLYALVGKVDFTVRHLSSSAESFPSSWTGFSTSQHCISSSHLCDAYTAPASSETTWTMRTTFPEYMVALATIVGSVLFTIFGGVGIACLPLGLIFSFVRRPKAVITRSQYIKGATELAKKARELKKAIETLHQEERSGSKGRKWRKNLKETEKELFLLEDDMKALEEMYPQGEQAETTWALTVLGYLAKLVLGVVGLIISVAWVAHIVIYLLIEPPISPFLNEVFIKLDSVWGLLGTAAFAFFCFYLLLAVIAGEMMLGLKLVFITIHPMKWGGTLMNSFLFNVGLILLCSISVIQFCATAFAYYSQATAAQEIFGHTLQSLRGIKYLYKYNIFQYGFVAFAVLTLFYYAVFLRPPLGARAAVPPLNTSPQPPPQHSQSPSPSSTPFTLHRSSSSSFKDICSLFVDDVDFESDDPSSTPSFVSPCPSPVLHRVRSASSALRQWCAPPEDLFGLPPGEQKRVVLYFTSLHAIRKTFDDCHEVRTILRALRVAVDERDVSMDTSFMKELNGILGSRCRPLRLPQVFIGGRHFGGVEEVRRLYETGELSRYVEGTAPAAAGTCDGCGDLRFAVCRSCSGSCRCYHDKGGGVFRTCTACNENGLVRCPLCCTSTTV
ncbi:hypothetical protein Cni_G09373 [Canna indica]|uniref:Glutaredoxin domain-containing protein n=1 Tax=Canna indica TaxID=4628 RepID=A0AAQ3Q9K1_9LILI|nr:hypothetical protein Cni_G09373 [Canna indica]